jgi:hypothetical protein
MNHGAGPEGQVRRIGETSAQKLNLVPRPADRRISASDSGSAAARSAGSRRSRRVLQTRVECGLLLRGGKRPGRASATFGPKDETHLLGWPEAVGMVRTERRAGFGVNQRTQVIAAEIALVARRLAGTSPWHSDCSCPSTAAIKAVGRPSRQSPFRKLPRNLIWPDAPRLRSARDRHGRRSPERSRASSSPPATARCARAGHGRSA